MRCYITPVTDPTAQEAVAEHLKQQFGAYQNCGGVLAPPKGAVLEVLEDLQTCNPEEGWGTQLLPEGHVLPTGIYRVLDNIYRFDNNRNECWLMLEKVPGNATARAFFCAGIPGKSRPGPCFAFFPVIGRPEPPAAMMDWRGVVNPNGPAPSLEFTS